MKKILCDKELSEEFSRNRQDGLLKLRERRTLARVIICQWLKQGLIVPVGNNRYKKVTCGDRENRSRNL